MFIFTTEEPGRGEERSSLLKMSRNITLKFGIYLTDYLGTHTGREQSSLSPPPEHQMLQGWICTL
jgi:hypothetical protein